MPCPSDSDYKQLFAFPELACELLCAAIDLPWTRQVRPGDFERVNASYINADGRQRHDDIVWCLHRHGHPSLYMLLEFQSRPDKWMALRLFSYAGLLCEDLVRQRRATHGRLPLLLPIVLYTGRGTWTAATSLATLRPQSPPGLETRQPELNYLLVDRSSSRKGIVPVLLELEHADDRRTDLAALLRTVTAWLKRHPNPELDAIVSAWIRRRLTSQFPGIALPPIGNMEEVTMMFERNFRTLQELVEFQATERGLEKGFRQGIEKGMEQGIKQGIKQGIEKGIEKGLEQGLRQAKQQIVSRLLQRAGARLDGRANGILAEASREQLDAWIDALLDSGRIPDKLAS